MTIRHVVAWKLAAEDPQERDADAREMSQQLMALRDMVPSIIDIRVGPDVVGGDNWDVALVADFADTAALEEYLVHPEHQRVVAYVRSVVTGRMSVDFEV